MDERVGPAYVIVMGVSGAGKSTFGRQLAQHIGAGFVDADDHHPEANKRMMAAGQPLGDAERWPWLRGVAVAARARLGAGDRRVVIACSALKRSYRSLLAEELGNAVFLHLDGDPGLIRDRMRTREGHFMPPSMLDSQFATLERLDRSENGAVLDTGLPLDALMAKALALIGDGPGLRRR